jgi:hypothetical protein
MDTGAESHVPGRAAPDVKLLRAFPAARVAIGGGQEQQHLLALAEPHAADFGVPGRGAEERLHRRLEPQHLLEGKAYQRRIVTQDGPLLRIFGEAIEGVAEAIDGGIDPGRQERAHQHTGFCF